ncbi:Cas4 family exonuclease [Gordonia phage RobinSparkles]|nr:Cas4 family exonuclease [Gordonia phage RobinSparkles]
MRPANNRVSASSLQTYEECPQQFAVKYVDYIPGSGSADAANEGTAMHHACQMHVQECLIDKTHQWSDVKRLLKHLEDGYKLAFGTALVDQDSYKESAKLIKQWHKRMANTVVNNPDVQILAVEEKKFHDIFIGGVDTDIDLTYIFDRVQAEINEDGSTSIRVVDYKSVRLRWTHEDLRKKIQMHIYAVAAMIEYQDWNPTDIWVEIDLLRHDQSLAIMFTREDCKIAWRYLRETVQKILDTDREKAEYKIGPGCRFCPIKATCPELEKSTNLGGTGVVTDLDIGEIARLRNEIDNKAKALAQLTKELDAQLLEHAKKQDILEWKDEYGNTITISSKGTRKILDQELVAKIIGPDKMAREGKINVTDLDRLIKNGELDDAQERRVKALIEKQFGALSVNVTPASAITEAR